MSNQYNPLTILRAGWSFFIARKPDKQFDKQFCIKKYSSELYYNFTQDLENPYKQGHYSKKLNYKFTQVNGFDSCWRCHGKPLKQ